MTQRSRIVRLSSVDAALKERQVLLRRRRGRRVVVHKNIDDAVRLLNADRSNFGGGLCAEAATLDDGRFFAAGDFELGEDLADVELGAVQ